ncbi:NADH-quinone oxidoreductase subunit NuoG [Gammaproteobacteria bacterium]|nr:NADH-quinone oxidoreductase subunit NuoG [Gammaproteobacteria bacterium]
MSKKICEIKVDDRTLKGEAGESIIAVTDRHGIYIPRFCYHKKLSVAANCRMCLVEVEGAPKTLPACATPISDGMTIKTKSPKTRFSQQAVMEFLLINHPLDCPICDQGGECELQDVAMGYGNSVSNYTQGKRTVADKNIGPYIATDLTRCIHCTRCVRFGQEIAGMPELGLNGRGENSQIRAFIKQGVASELSGNMIDLCPVGALTSKPYRFKGRSWGFSQHAVVMRHDAMGSHAYAHVHGGEYGHDKEVMRLVPKSHDAINESWLSDTDRYSYLGLSHEKRLLKPEIKQQGKWQQVSWNTAFTFLAKQFKAIIAEHGGSQVAGWMHPSATMEEGFAFQSLLRQFGVTDLDHRIHSMNADDDGLDLGLPILPIKLNELLDLDQLVVLGGDFRQDTPLLNHWIRKAANQGTNVHYIHGYQLDTNFKEASQATMPPSQWLSACHMMVSGYTETEKSVKASQDEKNLEQFKQMSALLKGLKSAKKSLVMIGPSFANHPDISKMQALLSSWCQSQDQKIQLGYVTNGSNAAGLTSVGVLPYRTDAQLYKQPGSSINKAIDQPKQCYWLHQIDPALDLARGSKAVARLTDAFTVICHSHDSPSIRQVGDVILPIASFLESSGTLMNAEGKKQWSQAALMPPEYVRPAWKVYCALAKQLDESSPSYETLDAIKQAIGDQLPLVLNRSTDARSSKKTEQKPDSKQTSQNSLALLGNWPGAKMDAVVRHASAIQEQLGGFKASMHCETAKYLGLLPDDNGQVKLKFDQQSWLVDIDDRVAKQTVVFAMGYDESALVGISIGHLPTEQVKS